MTRLFFILVCVLCAHEARADWSFSNGLWYWGGVPYHRTTYYDKCGKLHYKHVKAHVPQANISNVSNSYVYNLSYTQPAAEQGNTQFGYAPQLSLQSYGAVDVGATVDGLLRLSGDLTAGASSVAGDVKALTAEALAAVTAQNQATAAVAEIYAKTELLKAAQPSPQLNLKVGASVGAEQNQVFALGAPGPLVTQHCANCHAAGRDGAEAFNLGALATADGKAGATWAIASGKMPKGHELDAGVRLALIAEINQ